MAKRSTRPCGYRRGEQKLTYKKAGQLGEGGFVTDQDHGEAFHIKLAANGLNTHGQSSPAEYYTTWGAIFHPDLEDLEEPFLFKTPAQSPPETALPKSDYRYDMEYKALHKAHLRLLYRRATIGMTGKKRQTSLFAHPKQSVFYK